MGEQCKVVQKEYEELEIAASLECAAANGRLAPLEKAIPKRRSLRGSMVARRSCAVIAKAANSPGCYDANLSSPRAKVSSVSMDERRAERRRGWAEGAIVGAMVASASVAIGSLALRRKGGNTRLL